MKRRMSRLYGPFVALGHSLRPVVRPQKVECLCICNTRPLSRRNGLFAAEGPTFGLDAHQLDLQCAIFLRLGGGIRSLGLAEQLGLTPE